MTNATQTATAEEAKAMTSSKLDSLIIDAIKYHATVNDETKRIQVDRRITDLIADRRDALRLGN